MNRNVNVLINIIILITIIIIIIVVVVDDNAESGNSCLHSQSVGRKQVTCNPKMNYIHFSAIELGLFIVVW